MRRRRRRRNGGAWKGIHTHWKKITNYTRSGPISGYVARHKRRVNPRGGSYSAFVKRHKGLFKRMTFRQATKRIGMMWRKRR